MNHDRFEELLGRLVDDELTAAEQTELIQLVEKDPARLGEIRNQLEVSELIALSEDELKAPESFLSSLQERIENDPFVTEIQTAIHSGKPIRKKSNLLPWMIATAAVFALLVTSLFFFTSSQEPVIAELTEIEGSFQWIDPNGQVIGTLEEGQSFTSGTLESLAPDGMAKLKFHDGSWIHVWGKSSLSITANPQKVLRLHYGNAWIYARRQPQEHPLLVHTPEADLKVLGTLFNVLVNHSQTKLLVKKGLVRLTRNADGAHVDVPAMHRVLSSTDTNESLSVVPQRRPVVFWKSNLPKDVTGGRWKPEMHALREEVRAATDKGEMTEEEARRFLESRMTDLLDDKGRLYATRVKRDPATKAGLTYMASLSVLLTQAGPTFLAEGARFIVKGEVQTPTQIMVGFCALDSGLPSGGRYYVERNVSGPFELEIPISAFQFWGKSLRSSNPAGKELLQWWCSTDSQEANLMISGLELLAPEQ